MNTYTITEEELAEIDRVVQYLEDEDEDLNPNMDGPIHEAVVAVREMLDKIYKL